MRRYSEEQRSRGCKIGFVPTMGYFHEGHLSLMRKARKECDVVVISIFVNPTQFSPGEDLATYPRDFYRDSKLAREAGVDAIFRPSADQMYLGNYSTYVEEQEMSHYLCGKTRPAHFRGVATVVLKLFNIVQPHRAYFGQKDAQQAQIIRRMVRDLNVPITIRVLPIVRESDGMAMSSRNKYLTSEQRRQSLVLRQSLLAAKKMVDSGERLCYKITRKMRKIIEEKPAAEIEYISIVDLETLKDVKKIKGRLLIALAVRFGKARLIDNIIVKSE